MTPREEIRSLTQDDGELLHRFFLELRARPDITKFFHPHPFDRETATAIAAHTGKDVYLGMFSNGEIVGYAMLRGWDEGYVVPSFGVAVADSHQGQKVGSRLLRESLHRASEMGAKEVMLKVHPKNRRAHLWYLKEGFREFDRQLDGQIRMRLALDV